LQAPRPDRLLRFLRAASLVALAVLASALVAPALQEDEATHLETFDQVWTTVRDKHFDPELGGVDWDAVREELRPKAEAARSKNELRGILWDMLRRLGQSHLAVLPGEAMPEKPEGVELIHPAQQVWDTGSGFAVALDEGVPRVHWVEPTSSVDRAGVEIGWRVARVGDTEVPERCETTCAATFPLLAATGDSVPVEFVASGGEAVVVDVPLGERRAREYHFEGLPVVEIEFEHRLVESDVGYIRFSGFFDPALVMPQFHQAMESFLDTTGVIIDVRGNGGGIGSMTTAMISWFVEEEAVFGTMVARDHEFDLLAFPRAETYGGRVAVLIDRGSGSSSEVFAAGMRDVAGARLFGARTTGAVLPSAFERLPNGDYLQYIIANYVTVHGDELEGDGVAPDVETDTRRTPDPLEDEALLTAIDWIYGHE
jgi:carboxyl-terminal processing protease